MKCPHCGFVNSDYSYRCVKCNKDLANASKFKHPPQPPQNPNINTPQSNQQINTSNQTQNKWTTTTTNKTQQFSHTKTTINQPSSSGLPDFAKIFMKPTNEIRTFLIPNIIATLLCCMPLGIIGLFFSTNVQHHIDAGNLDEARKSSERAWLFMVIAYGSGFIFGSIYLLFQILTILGNLS